MKTITILHGELVDVGNGPGGPGLAFRLDDEEQCDALEIRGLRSAAVRDAAPLLYSPVIVTITIEQTEGG